MFNMYCYFYSKYFSMKHLFLFTIIILFTYQTKAQKISFTDTTNEWYYATGYHTVKPKRGYVIHYYNYNYKGDSSLNNKNYKKLCGGISPIALVRFDSSDNKVYVIVDSNKERTLYDYNLKLGDTIKSAYQLRCETNGKIQYIEHFVRKIDSVLLNNVYHKRMSLSMANQGDYNTCFARDYDVIEGIGCTFGILFPLYGIIIPAPTYSNIQIGLNCFKNNGKAPTSTGISFICNDTTLNITKTFIQNEITLYPQPAHSSFTIELPNKINSGALNLYNNIGQRLYQKTITNQNEIRVTNLDLPSGIYYYNIQNNSRQNQYRGKLLIE